MRSIVKLSFFFVIVLAFLGCGNKDGYSPVSSEVSQNEELANVVFKIVGSEENSDLKASLNGGQAEVVFSFKLLKPNSPNDFDMVRKTAPVVNGKAEFAFYGLPARVAIANLEIKNGRLGDYSTFKGAQTLKPGDNNIFLISGCGSNDVPDSIAGALEELIAGRKIPVTTTDNLVLDMISAYDKTLADAVPNSVGLIKNIAEVYLLNKSKGFNVETTNVYQRHLMQLLLSITTGAQNAYSKANQFNGWEWSDTYQFWSYFQSSSTDVSFLQTFAFIDPELNSYKTSGSSTSINGFKYGSSIRVKSSAGLIKTTETYFLTNRADKSLEVFGTYKGYLNDVQTIQIGTDHLVVASAQPYPISGSIKIDLNALGVIVVNFNGTCVAEAIHTDSSGQATVSRLFLEKYSILNQSFVTELSLRPNKAFPPELAAGL